MKMVVAYIQPERLNPVKQALFKAEILKMSVTNALGCGEEQSFYEVYRGVEHEVSLHKKVRLEIALNEAYLDKAVAAIIEGAKTGEVGDGKIFVYPLEDCIRIRTGERGGEAIG